MSIKNMVKGKEVHFLFYKNQELWYTTECGFTFPVPTNDIGAACMKNTDKAILFMRWIRKELSVQEDLRVQVKNNMPVVQSVER